MGHSLDGWSLGRFDDVEWGPWGSQGDARAKVLATADGHHLALVEAAPGYCGDPHRHGSTEFLYVVDGELTTQGRTLGRGDGYVAAAGSAHTQFATETGATYLSIFSLDATPLD